MNLARKGEMTPQAIEAHEAAAAAGLYADEPSTSDATVDIDLELQS